MNSADKINCSRCGASLPGDGPDELCPACALSLALTLPPGESGDADGSIVFSRSEPSVFPCELGRYRLLGKLGQGGMGSVYEAEELATGRRLALKMLGQKLDSPDMRQRFLREGRLAASVSHPNSLYVFGTEEIEDHPAIAYGFLERGFDATVVFCLVLFIAWWVGLFHAIAHPRQGLHDKLAGCWLVRR